MSHISPPAARSPVRWGILATGNIATKFAADLDVVDGAELVAVGSRTLASAKTFVASLRDRQGGPSGDQSALMRAHGSYAELLADPDVDVIYVATPHGRHVEDVMACFEAGKSVLCEKALTLNAAQAADLVAEARGRGLFFAEAMWMRCNPNIRRIRQMVRDGSCGNVRQVRADLGFVGSQEVTRLWDPALGAGALLDVGIYPLTFAYLILGQPVGVSAAGVLSDRGVDVNAGATLTYANGAVASISWTQTSWSDNRASISGDGGRIELASRMHEPASFDYIRNWESDQISEKVIGNGYAHEIVEVGECLRAGKTESALLPLDETVAILGLMDRIREQIGVRYDVDAG